MATRFVDCLTPWALRDGRVTCLTSTGWPAFDSIWCSLLGVGVLRLWSMITYLFPTLFWPTKSWTLPHWFIERDKLWTYQVSSFKKPFEPFLGLQSFFSGPSKSCRYFHQWIGKHKSPPPYHLSPPPIPCFCLHLQIWWITSIDSYLCQRALLHLRYEYTYENTKAR